MIIGYIYILRGPLWTTFEPKRQMLKPDQEIRNAVAKRKARGNIVLKKGLIVSVEERETRRKRAEHTPYLDKLLKLASNP